nr:hypothetical protein [Tanacetum cinerariifolium]
HGDVCLSWGRWGEFVRGRGSGGFWSAVFAIYSHGDVCLGWGRWGEFVRGRGSGGDRLESRGSGVMGDGGKTG